MALPFVLADAIDMLYTTLFDRPGATRDDNYNNATDWDSFFLTNPNNTKLFVQYFEFTEAFPECEQFILQNPTAIVRYAVNGLQQRWPAGEAVLLDNSVSSPESMRRLQLALVYAKSLIAPTRWLEFEALLISSTQPPRTQQYIATKVNEIITTYLTHLVQTQVSNLEDVIFQNGDILSVLDFLRVTGRTGTIDSFETNILSKINANNATGIIGAIHYAISVKQQRWPAFESIVSRYTNVPEYHKYQMTLIPVSEILTTI